MLQNILFYLLATLAVGSAGFAVFTKKPFSGVLSLVLTMFALSGLFILLDAYFVAIIQILIYAGAILVLFLFVLMLMGIGSEEDIGAPANRILSGLLAALFIGELAWLFRKIPAGGAALEKTLGTVESVGRNLFLEHLLPFELVSLILLVGVVGAIALSQKESLHD